MSRYQIEYSIPFVGFQWRTDLFSIHTHDGLKTHRTNSFADEIRTRLQPVSLPGRTRDAILNMVIAIDDYEDKLHDDSHLPVVTSLGLGNTRPMIACEAVQGRMLSQLANVFVRAVIVDRILWALCIGVLEPFTQYINDDYPVEVPNLDLSRYEEPIKAIAHYLAISEDVRIEYSDSLSGDSLRCGVSGVKHEGLGVLHSRFAQLYYVATMILSLGTPEASLSGLVNEFWRVLSFWSLPIGDSLRGLLQRKISQLHQPRELKAIHTAVTGSILDVLLDEFIEKNELNKKRWKIDDLLKSSHAIPKNMTPSILRAEQVVWLTLVDIMGGEAVRLTNSVTLIAGISDTSKKLTFELQPSSALTSSFGSIDPVLTNTIIRFSQLEQTEVPIQVRHWKNPRFEETEDGGSASASGYTCPLEDPDSDDDGYCGLENLLSVQATPRDSMGRRVDDRGWSADSHAAELSRKRPFKEVEADGAIPINTQRRRIEPAESESIDTRGDAIEGEDSQGDVMEAEDGQGGAMEAEDGQGDAMEAEDGQGDAMEAEDSQGDAMEAEDRQGDAMEAEDRQGHTMEAEDSRGDPMEAEGSQGGSTGTMDNLALVPPITPHPTPNPTADGVILSVHGTVLSSLPPSSNQNESGPQPSPQIHMPVHGTVLSTAPPSPSQNEFGPQSTSPSPDPDLQSSHHDPQSPDPDPENPEPSQVFSDTERHGSHYPSGGTPNGKGKPGRKQNVTQRRKKSKKKSKPLSRATWDSAPQTDSDGVECSDDKHIPEAALESPETFRAFFDQHAWDTTDTLVAHPHKPLTSGSYSRRQITVTEQDVGVWKYRCRSGKLEMEQQIFHLTARGHLPCVSEQMTELETLLQVSGHGEVNGPGTSGSVLTVLDTDIATWPVSKLREAHATHDIHIVPADPCEPMAFDAITCEALGINMDQPRELHANQLRCSRSDYLSQMRQSTLADFFTLLSQNDQRANNVNFLDIPLPFHQKEDEVVKKLSLLSAASQIRTATPFPCESLNWALVATVPAMSPIHFDAGKFCTMVKVLTGHKLWLVRDTEGPDAPEDLSECDIKSLKWIGCVLGPGHRLIMRPSTEHIVFTLENSIVVGSHFVSEVNMKLSMISGLREHWYGKASTNASHLASEVILYRILGFYSQRLDSRTFTTGPCPSDKDLAALLVMALNPQRFEPQPLEQPWNWPDTIREDRFKAKHLAISIIKQMQEPVLHHVFKHLKLLRTTSVEGGNGPLETFWTSLKNSG